MKHIPLNDNQFYPTPPYLIFKILEKIDFKNVHDILDPSAGKGDLLNGVKGSGYDRRKTYAIEIDKHLAAITKEAGHTLIDRDFLNYNGGMLFDLIVMNPPFADGDKHLLKAIDLMFNGQIVCILNAETLKNPYSNIRKDLVKKLGDLNADIEYIQDGFSDAERKTGVEIALIYIKIEQDFDDLYCRSFETAQQPDLDFQDGTELDKSSEDKNAYDYVAEYEDLKKRGIETIVNFFKLNYGMREYFSLGIKDGTPYSKVETYQSPKAINSAILDFTGKIKRKYWSTVFELPQFRDKLTSKERDKFFELVRSNYDLEFNMHNINQFYEHLLENSSKLIEDAIEELFDKITLKHSFHGRNPNEKNVHLYNGWKTNNGLKINKRFILPIRAWSDWYDGIRASQIDGQLSDIEKVFCYFNGNIKPAHDLSYLAKICENQKENTIENDYFKIVFYKKGTAHFTVKNDDILRRLNVFMGKRRQWLPPEYAFKSYKDSSQAEKAVIDAFEGEKEYSRKLNDPLMIKDKQQFLLEVA